MKELWLSWQLILEEDCLASCLLCIQSEFMANITKASINTFCMLTLGPRPSMQAALPNLPQQLWEFWVATRYKFRPPTRFQRTTHAMQACQAFQLYPTINRKISAPITEKGATKAQCSRACFCACKSSIWNGRQFPSKRLISNICIYIILILYTFVYLKNYSWYTWLPSACFKSIKDWVVETHQKQRQGSGALRPKILSQKRPSGLRQ